MKVWFVGGPHDGLQIELDPKLLVRSTPPAVWKVDIPQDPPALAPKHWLYYYSAENNTYYMRKGVHDG